MAVRITLPDRPSSEDRDAILALIKAHNVDSGRDPRWRRVAVMLADAQGERVGGLWGECLFDWLFVELLAVAEAHRGGGHGAALMAEAEKIARAHGCLGIWLDTFAFQARGFYEKLGFELFGTLEDHPVGQRRFFLRKRF